MERKEEGGRTAGLVRRATTRGLWIDVRRSSERGAHKGKRVLPLYQAEREVLYACETEKAESCSKARERADVAARGRTR